ncbi:LexA family protein [Thomasclavelia spiroformis]|uniref:LexA family protein n=1 Tax=Thomasclavelia spiroformis TaxID=29348 RepID=UPI0021476A77|nr:XRE family transcriptional regulator [Thomasclavelia spiroformis]MCR0185166.1 LexA repressor [[Clostridium] innocuum]
MELKEIIKEYKNRYHMNNKELAEQFGVSHNTVCRWLRGEIKSLQDDTAQRMSSIMGFDVQSFLQGTVVDLKKPVLGMVKAGYEMFLDQDYLGEEIVSSEEYKSGDFFLKVKGDSMKDSGIIEGSLVYVKATNVVRNGDIAVVCVDDEVTIKFYEKRKDEIALIPSNSSYETKVFSPKEASKHNIKIIGKVLFCKTMF